ncbi:DUF4157 domain-containing protein [Halobaculum sp. MBLA0147]|uniref:eCIS core domain-containing protein n=1 Tax=Halobaculum sp. MBLA0147 TaxID=3079934 RepID=UPI0035266FDA
MYGELDDLDVVRLLRMEANAPDAVHDRIKEGMPLAVANDFKKRRRWRAREDTPIPWDVERRNRRSKRRSVAATSEMEPAGTTALPECVRRVLSSPGEALDGEIRQVVEDRLGEKVPEVRIHTGHRATAAAAELDARAFTIGNHIVFGRGAYDPDSLHGQHILVHELAHVRQQTDTNYDASVLPFLGPNSVVTSATGGAVDDTRQITTLSRWSRPDDRSPLDLHIQRLPDWELGQPPDELYDSPDSLGNHPIAGEPACFGESDSSDYRRNFFREFPQLRDRENFVVHHAVEQQVLDRYPGVVSESEIHSVENLRGIPSKVNADLHLSKIRMKWNQFYRKHDQGDGTPSAELRDKLLEKATEIDDKYGHYFLPPVRSDNR